MFLSKIRVDEHTELQVAVMLEVAVVMVTEVMVEVPKAKRKRFTETPSGSA